MACYKRWWKLPEPRPEQPPMRREQKSIPHCRDCSRELRQRNRTGKCRSCWEQSSDGRTEKITYHGVSYRRYPYSTRAPHRRYFHASGGRLLHRAVYESEIGPIPDGWHVHHRDRDTSNNAADNLLALDPREHRSITVGDFQQRGQSWYDRDAMLVHLDRVRPLASEWHRSAEGREWHRRHAYYSLPWATRGIQPDDE